MEGEDGSWSDDDFQLSQRKGPRVVKKKKKPVAETSTDDTLVLVIQHGKITVLPKVYKFVPPLKPYPLPISPTRRML